MSATVVDFFGVPAPERRDRHEQPGQGKTNTWLTPMRVIEALGPFGLDPCAATEFPTRCAALNFTFADDGLHADGGGAFVFCNPPYGPHAAKWLDRCREHQHAIALVNARTETRWAQRAMPAAHAILFPAKRIEFLRADGSEAGHSTAPSMFLGYGEEAKRRLLTCSIAGVRVTPIREAA